MTRPYPVSSKLRHAHHHVQLDQTVVSIHSALVMDAAVPGPNKVLALLSSLGIVLPTHAIAIYSLPSYSIQSSSASSPTFF